MGESLLTLRRATERDHGVIIRLIDEAAEWLRTKNTDQWAQPWPSKEDRSTRIRRDLRAGKTSIAWDRDGGPVATLTADSDDSPIWPKEAQHVRAVYVCRVVVSRSHSGLGIGAALLDWAGLRALQRYGAHWIRIDVWTTNRALHGYYRTQGFEFYGFCEAVDSYPAAALFQKPTGSIRPARPALFRLRPPLDG